MDSSNIDVSTQFKVCPACGQLFVADENLCPQDNCALKVTTDEELVGTVFDNTYRILALLGTGGMSTVYKAMHKDLGTVAAIKMLRLSLLSDENTRARFIQEAQVLQALQNQNIVSIKEFHITNTGQPYLVMDYLAGDSLSALISVNPLPVSQALNLFLQICSALVHAHAQGVVHRDLKPSNIIVVNENAKQKAMLVDFGIAKLIRSNQGHFAASSIANQKLTKTGHAFGTPTYMSPEQWRGESVDARSDIYSFGCIMYESLTAKPPFDMETLAQIIFNNEDIPPSPIESASSQPLSRQVQELIAKCLSFERNKRPTSASELQSLLMQTPEYAPQDSTGVKNIPTQSTGRSTKRPAFILSAISLLTFSVVSFLCLAMFGNSGTASIIPTRCALILRSWKSGPPDIFTVKLKEHLATLYLNDKQYKNAVAEYQELTHIHGASTDTDQLISCAYDYKKMCKTLSYLPEESWKRKSCCLKAIEIFMKVANRFESDKNYKRAIFYTNEAIGEAGEIHDDIETVYSLIYVAQLKKKYTKPLEGDESLEILRESEKNADEATHLWGQQKDSAELRTLTEKLCLLSVEYMRMGWTDLANKILQEAIAVTDKHTDRSSARFQKVVDYLEQFGTNCYERRRYALSEQVLQQVLGFRQSAGLNTFDSARATVYLANCERQLGNFEVSEQLLNKSLDILDKTDGTDSYFAGLIYASFAELYLQKKNMKAALGYIEKSLPILRARQNENQGEFERALHVYAIVTEALNLSAQHQAASQELYESMSKKNTKKAVNN